MSASKNLSHSHLSDTSLRFRRYATFILLLVCLIFVVDFGINVFVLSGVFLRFVNVVLTVVFVRLGLYVLRIYLSFAREYNYREILNDVADELAEDSSLSRSEIKTVLQNAPRQGKIKDFEGQLRTYFDNYLSHQDEAKSNPTNDKKRNLPSVDMLLPNNFALKYMYDHKLCVISDEQDDIYQYIESTSDSKLDLVAEPDNEYDADAIAVYLSGKRIGYVYRANGQKMIHDWQSQGYPYCAYLIGYSPKLSGYHYKIMFYVPLDQMYSKTYHLVGINQMDTMFDVKRSESLLMCTDGDYVKVEYIYDCYIVYDDYHELGQLPSKANDDIKRPNIPHLGQLINMNTTSDDAITADIIVYF